MRKVLRDNGGDYEFLQMQNLVGLLVLVFVKNKIVPRVTEIKCDLVKTGKLGGSLGNKGGVLITMLIDGTRMTLVCCHLAAGRQRNKQRVMNLKDIMNKSFQDDPVTPLPRHSCVLLITLDNQHAGGVQLFDGRLELPDRPDIKRLLAVHVELHVPA